MTLPIRDLAFGILPACCRHKVIAVLYAYFDESGTHAGAQNTLIAGFVGPAHAWAATEGAWQNFLHSESAPPFHYTEITGQKKAYADWERWRGDLVIAGCADILAASALKPVAAGFTGDWERVLASVHPRWAERVPSRYHLAFEICVQQLANFSRDLWGNEPIAAVFARQDEYQSRAALVWHSYKAAGEWSHMHSLTYEDRKGQPRLDMADMIAHELYQCVTDSDLMRWRKWPFLQRILSKDETYILGGFHTTETAIAMMHRAESLGVIPQSA
jgi:hypothetical protein